MQVLSVREIGPEYGVVERVRFPVGLGPLGGLLGPARVEAHAALAERQPQAARGLLQPLQHLGDVDAPAGKQFLERDPFGRDLRVQGKRGPANLDLELFFQSFNTPGNEIAPGSDEVREDLQDGKLIPFFHGFSSFYSLSLFIIRRRSGRKERMISLFALTRRCSRTISPISCKAFRSRCTVFEVLFANALAV